eukprot:10915633-Heterocapsa_arctica.AAC.1
MKVKEVLRVTPIDIGLDFAQLKKLLKAYFDRGIIFDATDILNPLKSSHHLKGSAMEVDAVPKGKGKGAGPMNVNAKCFTCGKTGHVAKECRRDKKTAAGPQPQFGQ